MPIIQNLVESGRVADLIIAIMVAELIVIAWWRQRSGKGPRLRDVVSNVLSGAFLVLALKAALLDAPWQMISLPLVAALVAHLLYLVREWRQSMRQDQ